MATRPTALPFDRPGGGAASAGRCAMILVFHLTGNAGFRNLAPDYPAAGIGARASAAAGIAALTGAVPEPISRRLLMPRRLKVRLRTLTPSIEVRILTGHPEPVVNQ